MAKAERKNTICPTGYLSPRKRTSADITANSSAEITLSAMALRTFMRAAARPPVWVVPWRLDGREKRAGDGIRKGGARGPTVALKHISAVNGGFNDADLHRAGKFHRAGNSQRPGQPEAGGCVQGN